MVLALGNDILGDDGAAFVVAGKLEKTFGGSVEIVKSGEAGLALLDILKDYDKVLIIDTVCTGERPPGTVKEFTEKDFKKISVPSPHFTGLPDVIALARELKMPFPGELRLAAVEIIQPEEFSEELTPVIKRSLPVFVRKASAIISGWLESDNRKA